MPYRIIQKLQNGLKDADFKLNNKFNMSYLNESFEEFVNEMAMSPEEKKERRKLRREAKKKGEKLPRITKSSKGSAVKKKDKDSDDKLKKWMISVETDDYQNRGGNYPASGRPDMINTWGTTLTAEFKSTSERTAKQWMENFCKNAGFKPKKVTTYQTGDYRDDWVGAEAEF